MLCRHRRRRRRRCCGGVRRVGSDFPIKLLFLIKWMFSQQEPQQQQRCWRVIRV